MATPKGDCMLLNQWKGITLIIPGSLNTLHPSPFGVGYVHPVVSPFLSFEGGAQREFSLLLVTDYNISPVVTVTSYSNVLEENIYYHKDSCVYLQCGYQIKYAGLTPIAIASAVRRSSEVSGTGFPYSCR